MKSIFTRRSIRQYTAQDVPDEMVQQLLKAAMYAPSAGNERPWHFIVVKDKEKLATLSNVSPYATMTKDAALAIIVCGDLNLQKFEGYWIQDCAAATQNILLEAEDEGLGAVWLGIYPIEERLQYIRGLFALPERIMPFAMIPVGYPAQHPATPERCDAARIHHETW